MLRTALIGLLLTGSLAACSTAYYGAMEKVGVHKRDILVSRVEKASKSQEDAQEEFKSALEQFAAVVNIEDSDLEKSYNRLNKEYEDAKSAADTVSERIDDVEKVSKALFKEWKNELDLYQNTNLRAESQRKLEDTKRRYAAMMATMREAEVSMHPVLNTFRDNVLFLKHNLNARAIGALRSEFTSLQSNIDQLIARMNRSIASSNDFIANIKE
ncbi:MAG: DUF2959 domain-containing protein [Thiotrichales bacterium]